MLRESETRFCEEQTWNMLLPMCCIVDAVLNCIYAGPEIKPSGHCKNHWLNSFAGDNSDWAACQW